MDEFGGLDIAFNNAGTDGAALSPLDEESEEDPLDVMDVKFFGLWHSMKVEFPALQARGGGVIIKTTSVTGMRGLPALFFYMASKFAVEGLSRSIALEAAGAKVRINTNGLGTIGTKLLDRATGGAPACSLRWSRCSAWAACKRAPTRWPSSPPSGRRSSAARAYASTAACCPGRHLQAVPDTLLLLGRRSVPHKTPPSPTDGP